MSKNSDTNSTLLDSKIEPTAEMGLSAVEVASGARWVKEG